MRGMMLAFLMAIVAGTAFAADNDSAIGNETPTADQAQDKAESDTTDDAKPEEPFKVPAGYQAKKRGKKTVYCKKAMESGTRFSQEKCYSEETLRAPGSGTRAGTGEFRPEPQGLRQRGDLRRELIRRGGRCRAESRRRLRSSRLRRPPW